MSKNLNSEDSKGTGTDSNSSPLQVLRQGFLVIIVQTVFSILLLTAIVTLISVVLQQSTSLDRSQIFWLGFLVAGLVGLLLSGTLAYFNTILKSTPKSIKQLLTIPLRLIFLLVWVYVLYLAIRASYLYLASSEVYLPETDLLVEGISQIILPKVISIWSSIQQLDTGFLVGAILSAVMGFFLGQIRKNLKEITSLYKKITSPLNSSLNNETVSSHNSSLNTRHFNPYVVGPPVPPDKFYGRRRILQKILASIKSGNHVAIYGERRIGKTSLLHRLEYLLKEETDVVFVPLFIQMQMISEDNFFKALIDAILKSTPPSVKKSLSLARETSAQPYEGLDLLSDLETVIKAWRDEAGKLLQLVFLLDEGDRLNSFSEATQMQLRGLLQDAFINQHVRLVWCGVGIDRTWQSDTSPWFNLFKAEFHVDSLKPEEARRLILEPVAGVYDYEAEAVTRIQELSLNKPYLIQSLCSNLIDYVQERGMTRGRLTLQDVEALWADIQQKDQSVQSPAYESTQPQVQIAESQTKYETSENNSL